jgi:mutator protein MutT
MLLCRRSRDRESYPGVWDIPGGHLDHNESPAQALTRELKEELGIEPQVPAGEPWITMHAKDTEFSIYIVDRWLGEPRNCAPDEHDELRWISPSELAGLELAHPSYVELLTRAMNAER